MFYSFFSWQCFLISNNSSIPSYINHTTEKRFSTVVPSVEDIGKIIQNADSNKVHGHDNISIHMLKTCSYSIYRPIEVSFKQALLIGVFSFEWKKGSIVPAHKKVTSIILAIIVQFLCFRFAVKSLKD